MALVYWDMAQAAGLASFYNGQIVDIPYCYAVSADEFQAGIELGDRKKAGETWREQLVAEERQGAIQGFIHLAVKTRPDKQPHGYIRFFCYARGQRHAGQQLVAAGERFFRAAGVGVIDAFTPYEGYLFYHAGRGFVVDRWAHVYGLLGINKYRMRHAQVFMEKALAKGPEPVLPETGDGLSSVTRIGSEELPEVNVQLLRAGQVVGDCHVRPVGQLQRSPCAAHQCYIPGLWLGEDLRGKGLGRYLVERTHWEMARRGYRQALIGTELDNYRAQQLYASDGYALVLTEYSFSKQHNPT